MTCRPSKTIGGVFAEAPQPPDICPECECLTQPKTVLPSVEDRRSNVRYDCGCCGHHWVVEWTGRIV
jgi:hypothetical protein